MLVCVFVTIRVRVHFCVAECVTDLKVIQPAARPVSPLSLSSSAPSVSAVGPSVPTSHWSPTLGRPAVCVCDIKIGD